MIKINNIIFVLLIYFFNIIVLNAQSVGLVFSGGGVKSFSQIGIIKALEENNIPIDYIVGTSMGAVIGSLYSSGYTVEEIKDFFNSEILFYTFDRYQNRYIYQKTVSDPRLFRFEIKFFPKFKIFFNSSYNNTSMIDFELLAKLFPISVAKNYNFDSLYIPFRVVSSDIIKKKEYIFKYGNLNDAVRTSISYPYIFRPIQIDDKYLLDGGLYNNFPLDIMSKEFNPDYIIGVNFYEENDFEIDNIQYLTKELMINRKKNHISPSKGIIMKPDLNFETFNINKIEEAIQIGYEEAIKNINKIKQYVKKTESNEDRKNKRQEFKKNIKSINIKDIKIEGDLVEESEKHVKNYFKNNNLLDLKEDYLKLSEDIRFHSVYPTLEKISDSIFDFKIVLKKEKNLILGIGGNLSNRPVSHIFSSLEYNFLRKKSLTLYVNGYYGRLYAGAEVAIRMDFRSIKHLNLNFKNIYNRWNYYKSNNFFFDEDKPSFLIKKELITQIAVEYSLKKYTIKYKTKFFNMNDNYFQTKDFTAIDENDYSKYSGNQNSIEIVKSTLNNISFPTKGEYFKMKVQFINLTENYIPGTTVIYSKDFKIQNHSWKSISLKLEKYLELNNKNILGISFDGIISSQNLFNNYTASILRANKYRPTIESTTLFLETFRAFQYGAMGIKYIYKISNKLSFRFENYLFLPYQQISNFQSSGKPQLEKPWKYIKNDIFFITSSKIILNSHFGPFSLGVNYYNDFPEISKNGKTPISIFLNFGYILFNEDALN